MTELRKIDVSGVEDWREYDFEGRSSPYVINKPVMVWTREGGTTHRVEDAQGVVHCVPAPGFQGCVLRWKGKVIA